MYKLTTTQMGAVSASQCAGFKAASTHGVGSTQPQGEEKVPVFIAMSEEDIDRAIAEDRQIDFTFKPWPRADLF